MTSKLRLLILVLAPTLCLIGGAPVIAAGESVQIQNVSPQAAITPGVFYSFNAVAAGFTDPVYAVSDSFSASGATLGVIDKIGYFTWTPGIYDAGMHTITVTVTDYLNHSATTSRSVIVTGNTVILKNLLPGTMVAPGDTVTFSLVAPGFVTPNYAVYDSGARTSVGSANIDANGAFSWKTNADDVGIHQLTLAVSDPYGHNAQTQISVMVKNPIATSTAVISAPPVAPTVQTSSPTATSFSSASSVSATPYVFTRYLGVGSRGVAVTELQKRLSALGYFSGVPSGYFGALTAASVKKYQAAKGLAQVGFVGPATRSALNQ